MATRRHRQPDEPLRRPPAITPEGRENQLISLTVDLAERQIREGTASSQVMTHFLKMGSTREILEQERIRHENELLKVKKESLERADRMEDLFADAIKAMSMYQGNDEPGDDLDDFDD